jgi:hypothetical protein
MTAGTVERTPSYTEEHLQPARSTSRKSRTSYTDAGGVACWGGLAAGPGMLLACTLRIASKLSVELHSTWALLRLDHSRTSGMSAITSALGASCTLLLQGWRGRRRGGAR